MATAEEYIQWLNKKLKLNKYATSHASVLNSWKVNRGQIYTCFLGENIGYEKSRKEIRDKICQNFKKNSSQKNYVKESCS